MFINKPNKGLAQAVVAVADAQEDHALDGILHMIRIGPMPGWPNGQMESLAAEFLIKTEEKILRIEEAEAMGGAPPQSSEDAKKRYEGMRKKVEDAVGADLLDAILTKNRRGTPAFNPDGSHD